MSLYPLACSPDVFLPPDSHGGRRPCFEPCHLAISDRRFGRKSIRFRLHHFGRADADTLFLVPHIHRFFLYSSHFFAWRHFGIGYTCLRVGLGAIHRFFHAPCRPKVVRYAGPGCGCRAMIDRMIVRKNGITSRIHVVQGRIAPSEQGRGRSGEQAAGMRAAAGIGSIGRRSHPPRQPGGCGSVGAGHLRASGAETIRRLSTRRAWRRRTYT